MLLLATVASLLHHAHHVLAGDVIASDHVVSGSVTSDDHLVTWYAPNHVAWRVDVDVTAADHMAGGVVASDHLARSVYHSHHLLLKTFH